MVRSLRPGYSHCLVFGFVLSVAPKDIAGCVSLDFVQPLILAVFFGISLLLSNEIVGRMNRSRPHRRGQARNDPDQPKPRDEIAHWLDKQE